MFHHALLLGIAGSLIGTAAVAHSDPRSCNPDFGNTVKLAATARAEVIPDEAVITLGAIAHGSDVAAATQDVSRQVSDAIAAIAHAPGVVVETTGFQTNRDYRFVNGVQVPDGWTVRDQLILRSRHFKALGDLTGRLSKTLHVEATGTRMSAGLRERVGRMLTSKAIAAFRAKAASVTSDFGLNHPALCTIDVGRLQGDLAVPRPPYPVMAVQRAMTAAPIPIAPGESAMSVTVSGSIRMQ